jgi:hypothetical protein
MREIKMKRLHEVQIYGGGDIIFAEMEDVILLWVQNRVRTHYENQGA